MTSLDLWLDHQLDALARAQRLRHLRTVDPIPREYPRGARVEVDGRERILFSSNDYLGLSTHAAVVGAARESLDRGGLGPRGSALVCGRTSDHAALERDLARLVGTEAALLLPSGWAANAGTLAALADEALGIFSDQLNHASLIEGCRLAERAGAEVRVYRHLDLEHLESLLEASTKTRKLVVTDSVFSMDGDEAPLVALTALCRRFGAAMLVDEAHATLLRGARGAGLAEELGVAHHIDIHVGTLSKAVGASGGFVAGSTQLISWLTNRNRAGVFSTALPLPVVAAAGEALRVATREPELRARVERARACFDPIVGTGRSPIVVVILGGEAATLAAAARLDQAGFFVPAIRPPTVAPGTSRLRITVSAIHTEEQVEALVRELGG